MERRKLLWMVSVRHAEQCPVTVRRQIPDFQVSGARNQHIIIIVSCPAERIIADVDLAARLQQLHLVEMSELPEQVDCFRDLHFVPVKLNILFDNLAHPRLYQVNVPGRQWITIALVNAAEESFRDGAAHYDLAVRENVQCRLI